MQSRLPLVSNGSDKSLAVWIEPWCDELVLPPRATLGCAMLDAPPDSVGPELEINSDGTLVVWASAPGRIRFAINDIDQDTGSAEIALPDVLLPIPVKQFIQIAFGNAPEARPGGLNRARSRSRRWWHRLAALFGR